MKISSAIFTGSFPRLDQCPKDERPQFAFIGRSNVGKSSLINFLTGQSKLAKVSGTPGKTITINFFLINKDWYLVDMPGYGYAQRSRKAREDWVRAQQYYLTKNEKLFCVLQLIDSRIPPQESDIDQTNFLGEHRIPLVHVFTKADKQKSKEVQANIAAYHQALSENWEVMPPYFVTSAERKHGREDLLKFIEETIRQSKA